MKDFSIQTIKDKFKKMETIHYFNPEMGLNVFFNKNNNNFI